MLALDESRAQEARAAYAYVTANLNQRAGPGTQFPPIVVIPNRSQVLINGCLPNLAWCEGTYGETRGWMSAQYLRLYDYNRQAWVEVGDYARSTRLATFSFDLERYWAAHYPDRQFYPQRAAWLAPPRSPGVDNGVFYRELSPYGRWVLLEDRYVWMPEVERGWRPYTEGRWEYTQRYGWTWVSNEPFGWATYHYGRWAYSNRLGWVWVPGTQWAPAWVAWRGSDDHLAWAPLPPDAGPDFVLDEGFDEIPSYYWQVVPAASFLLPNLADAILRDEDEWRPSLDQSRPIGNVTVVNNVVVNNVVNIEYVEEKTRERVVPREIVITNEAARQAEPSEDVVRIYQPPVTEAPAAESPPAVLPAEVAAGQSQTAGQAGDEPATEDRVPEAAEEEAQLPPTEAPPLAEDEAPPPAEEQPAAEAPAPSAGEEPAPPAPAEEPPPPPPAEEPAPQAEEPPPPPSAERAPCSRPRNRLRPRRPRNLRHKLRSRRLRQRPRSPPLRPRNRLRPRRPRNLRHKLRSRHLRQRPRSPQLPPRNRLHPRRPRNLRHKLRSRHHRLPPRSPPLPQRNRLHPRRPRNRHLRLRSRRHRLPPRSPRLRQRNRLRLRQPSSLRRRPRSQRRLLPQRNRLRLKSSPLPSRNKRPSPAGRIVPKGCA